MPQIRTNLDKIIKTDNISASVCIMIEDVGNEKQKAIFLLLTWHPRETQAAIKDVITCHLR